MYQFFVLINKKDCIFPFFMLQCIRIT